MMETAMGFLVYTGLFLIQIIVLGIVVAGPFAFCMWKNWTSYWMLAVWAIYVILVMSAITYFKIPTLVELIE